MNGPLSRSAAVRVLLRSCQLLLLLPAVAPAGEPAVRFDRLGRDDGLSSSRVWSVHQDARGFLWLGTADGLNRYDGYGVRVYENDPLDASSLSNNEVTAIVEDREGGLWVGTRGEGLNRLDPLTGRFRSYRHDPSDPRSLSHDVVWNLLLDSTGTLWVATRAGLNRFDPEGGGFVRYLHDPGVPASLSSGMVNAVCEDRSGALWIATYYGLNRFERGSDGFTRYLHDPSDPHSLVHDRVNDVHADDEGFIWVATAVGLDRLDPSTGWFERRRLDPPSTPGADSEITALEIDRTGALWVGLLSGGLHRLDRSTGASVVFRHDPADPHSLTSGRVNSILEDRGGLIWTATNTGVAKYDRRRELFEGLALPAGSEAELAASVIYGLYEDSAGTLWIGTLHDGLFRLDRRGSSTHYRADPAQPGALPHDTVSVVLEDRRGELWIGTIGGGLARFDRGRERFEPYRYDGGDSRRPVSEFIADLLEDADGRLWIATAEGLFYLDAERASLVGVAALADGSGRLDQAWFKTAYEDRDRVLWFGTNAQGLYRLDADSESLVGYRHDAADPTSLGSDQVAVIFESSAGVLWVGTLGGGLCGLDRERRGFECFTTADGLAGDLVAAILEDGAGHLWISTRRGLSRFDPRSRSFQSFDAGDGLVSDEFSARSAWRSRDGRLYFGGYGGLSVFDPVRIELDPYPPPVVVTDFHLGPLAAELEATALAGPRIGSEPIELSHRQRSFSFEFAALHFARPSKNRYAYRLEGFDPDWIETDATKRFATYTNLDPGDYVFRVRASNHHGVWNDDGAAVAIVVRPPAWRTGWAYGLYALGTAAAVAGLVGAHRRKLERERSINARLRELHRGVEAQVELRTAELRQALFELEAKNAELESFTYSVSHDLKSPLMTIVGFAGLLKRDLAAGRIERLADDVRRIEEGARKMDRLLKELLELSRIGRWVEPPREVDFGELVAEALELLAAPIAERGVEVVVAPDLPPVVGDRVRLVQLLHNLLGNAVKFMGEQERPRVEVAARRGGETVFEIRDNGMGLDESYHDKVFGLFERLDPAVEGTGIGLALVKRIVEIHGGRIWVESQGAGSGSTFCFTLPGPAEGG